MFLTLANAAQLLTDRSDLAPTPVPLPSTFEVEGQVIRQSWGQATPDQATLAAMEAVATRFLHFLSRRGVSDLEDSADAALAYLEHAESLPQWHLYKNTLMAFYNTMRATGFWVWVSPLHGVRPPEDLPDPTAPPPVVLPNNPSKTQLRRARRKRNRIAFNDEILLARVSATLDTGADNLWLRAAALAIATTGAATAEGPGVRWADLTRHPDTGALQVTLPGRHLHDPGSGWHIAPRTRTLDPWAGHALSSWQKERAHYGRPPQEEWSITYEGNKPLDHPSAKNSFHSLISETLEVADLDWQPGLTPLAIAEWAAVHAAAHATDPMAAGMAVMGVRGSVLTQRIEAALTRAA